MRAIVLVPSPGDLHLRCSSAKVRRFLLITKKKTLNNVKANVFVGKHFCLSSKQSASEPKHLIYIYACARGGEEKSPKSLGDFRNNHYLCSVICVGFMMEFIRNIVAFASTFVVIATLVMIILHVLIVFFHHGRKINSKQERCVVWAGIMVAIILIPFYYLPA